MELVIVSIGRGGGTGLWIPVEKKPGLVKKKKETKKKRKKENRTRKRGDTQEPVSSEKETHESAV